MEVHQHAHGNHAKKGWREYFWEFLMLFLAVFCGFLAEYQLEHVIEHQREEKFAASLYEDLKEDSADIKGNMPFWNSVIQKADTARTEIEKPAAKRNVLLLYRCIAYMRLYSNFEYHDRTIEQLKNGGNFRLIRKPDVADSLIDYDALVKSHLRDQEMQSNDVWRNLNYLQDKFLNSKYVVSTVKFPDLADSLYLSDPVAFEILPHSEADLFEYYNRLQFYSTMTRFRIHTLRQLEEKSKNLISMLKKEYELP